MKASFISVLVAVAMLGACNSETGKPAGDQSSEHANSQDSSSAKTASNKSVLQPMFDGYRPGFKYELRSDKVTTNKDGKRVRRVIVEYIGDDQAKLIANIDHDMAKHGYAGKPWRQAAASTSTQYIKKGAQRVGITITPANDAAPTRSPDAGGYVKFVWAEKAS